MSNVIQTFNLTKFFSVSNNLFSDFFYHKVAPPAVDQVNFSVQTGELFGLLGPNGAGKTTLLKILATLVLPSSGEAWVNGYSLKQVTEIKSSLGVVTTDERSFYWRLTGRQNLEFFAHLRSLPLAEIPARIEETLGLLNLRENADRPFKTYSTGMRQRLAIARALLHDPKILFLDEPTRGLDPQAIQSLHQFIRQELTDRRGITILLTTHWLQEAEKLCDRIAFLHRGQVQACGTFPELRAMMPKTEKYRITTIGTNPGHAQPERFIPNPVGEAPPLNQWPLLEDVIALNQTIDTLRAQNIPIQSITREQIPLETLFEHFTQIQPVTVHPSAPLDLPSLPHSHTPIPSPRFLHVALAFLKRDWRSETSYHLAFLLEFAGIFFSVAVFYFINQLIGDQVAPLLTEYGGNYFAFVLVGIAFSRFFGVGISSFASNLRQAQTTGTLEAMLTTPTSLSAIIISSSLWNFGLVTLQVVVYLLIGALLLGVPLQHGNFLAALVILLLSIVIFSSLGILAAGFIMVLKRGDPITWLLNVSFTLLGGVYYPISVLPNWMQGIANLLPVTYGLRAMRLALLQGGDWATLLPDLVVLFFFGSALLPLSLYAFRMSVRRAQQEGSLTHY